MTLAKDALLTSALHMERRAQNDRRAPTASTSPKVRLVVVDPNPADPGAGESVIDITPPWSSDAIRIHVPARLTFADLGIRRDTITGLFEFNLEAFKCVLTASQLLKCPDQKSPLTVELIYAVVRALYESAGLKNENVPSEQEEFVRSMETPRFVMLTLAQSSSLR
jgi:hypothetical protein